MNQEQRDRVLECKAVGKRMIAELEASIGADAAFPVTIKLLESINEMEVLIRE